MSKAWSLIAMGGEQQYAGNKGYDDDVGRIYSYDNFVSNSTKLSEGDLIFLRDGEHLLGIATVESIDDRNGVKTRNRCPECGTSDIKPRRTMRPKYRCDKGHQFDVPREQRVSCTVYQAHYESTYKPVAERVPKQLLKDSAPRRNDQLAIEEIDTKKLLGLLSHRYPATHALLQNFLTPLVLSPSEALEEDEDEPSTHDEPSQTDSYASTETDTRETVQRQIKARRGQRKFRNGLIKRYGVKCLVSGCALLDVLEAAHIWPLRNDHDNHPENGLLLRSDLHTLFDLYLLSIEPDSLTIRLAPHVAEAEPYKAFEGAKLSVAASRRPSRDPLRRHWKAFTKLRLTESN